MAKTVVNKSPSVEWPTKTVDLVSGGVDKRDPVSADAEEPLDALSNRLPVTGHVVVLAVAWVDSSVGSTTGAAVMVVGYRVRMTAVATRGNSLKIKN